VRRPDPGTISIQQFIHVKSQIESLNRRIEISDEKLGIDVISEAGPGGTFIDTEHTVRHFREELWFPELLDREYYQSWLDSGASTMETRCRKRKEEILDAHQPEPISPELDRALDQLVAAAKRDLRPKAATDR